MPEIPCNLCSKKYPVLRPTGYLFFPLSHPAQSANTFCCLFVGLCEMIFSPPKRNSSRRECFLEAGPSVKTCKCHIIVECFDWLWERVSTWAALSLLVLLAKQTMATILSLAWVWQLVEMVPVTVYIHNIWCLVFWWWQPKLDGSESVECRGKPCLPRIQLTI